MSVENVTWVIQSNAIGASDLDTLTSVVQDLRMRVEHLRVIPFSHEPADSLPAIDGTCIVYGSSGLLRLARRVGWAPSGWDGPRFNGSTTKNHLGSIALNSAAIVTPWSNVAKVAFESGWHKVFVRPDAETKEFAGRVYEIEELTGFVGNLKAVGYLAEQNNNALVGPALSIGREWRAFVVEQKIVSISQYADHGLPAMSGETPSEVIDFIRRAIEIYSPAPCFVVDAAEALAGNESDLRITEFNSINSAGFYACDITAIVNAVSQFAMSTVREPDDVKASVTRRQ